jgi:hypothetical protein
VPLNFGNLGVVVSIDPATQQFLRDLFVPAPAPPTAAEIRNLIMSAITDALAPLKSQLDGLDQHVTDASNRAANDVSTLNAKVDALNEKIAQLEAKPDVSADDQAAIDAMKDQVTNLQAKIDAIDPTIPAPEPTPEPPTPEPAPPVDPNAPTT